MVFSRYHSIVVVFSPFLVVFSFLLLYRISQLPMASKVLFTMTLLLFVSDVVHHLQISSIQIANDRPFLVAGQENHSQKGGVVFFAIARFLNGHHYQEICFTGTGVAEE